MLSFKGIRKFLIYACIAGWMFFLGIVVGRGTSPVTFDTREFSKKLEKMANIPDSKKEVSKKVDFKFYEDLDNPITQEKLTSKNPLPANIPEKETVKEPPREPVKETVKEIAKEPRKEPAKEVKKEPVKEPAKEAKKEPVKEPVKEAAKKESAKQESVKEIKKESVKEPVKEVTKEPVKETVKEAAKEPEKSVVKEPPYTIQIAAYKSFQEAVSKMAELEEKGFSSYRVKGEKDGITMYRVRIGPFETYNVAKEFKIRLDKAKVDAMIMKREIDEDIKE